MFIDASKEYEEGKKQNKLRDVDIKKIVETYNNWEPKDKYSYLATKEEIIENDFNLNIPRYVDTFEEEAIVDIGATKKEIERLEKELVSVREEMEGYLKELGL